MRSSAIEKHKAIRGFSLIEMAISLTILGALIAPAFYIYTLYQENQKRQETELALNLSTNTLGGYRSVYGRYPCPAPINAQRGSAAYGYEECDPADPGITQATNTAGDTILIGTIPFRALGVTEEEAYDGFDHRLTYAVTESLTDDDTFDMQGGGIGIVDVNGDTMITPAETAHFVVLSPNDNALGAWSREGVLIDACPADPALENENCDGDAIFRKVSRRADFDDRVSYMTNIPISHWQIAETPGYENDIHLIKADSFVVGLDANSAPSASAGVIDVTNFSGASGDAELKVTGGRTYSSQICDENGANCFTPTAIYGLHADSEGMDCGDDFLVGIENGGPVCETEVTFECPTGKYMKGIDPSKGNIICDVQPPPPCADAVLTTSCGVSRTVSGTYSSGFSFAYSGECHRSAVGDAAVISNVQSILSGGGTVADVEAYIDTVNATPRTVEACGPDENTALVRDSFLCEAGSWGPHNPDTSQYGETYVSEMAHERKKISNGFPGDPLQTGGRMAEGLNVPYDINTSVTGGVPGNHDCWCREDYRVTTPVCAAGLSGYEVAIEKHICPQTDHGEWVEIFNDYTTYCGCIPAHEGPMYDSRCYEYFGRWDAAGGELTGNVTRERDRLCPIAYTDWEYDLSQCRCHETWHYDTVSCPPKTGNSFTYDGIHYNNIASVATHAWECPTGDGGPVTKSSEVGDWGPENIVHTEPCVCDDSRKQTRNTACPSHLTGSGIQERRDWDCSLNPPDWGPWYVVSNSCYACVWTPPSGSGSYQTTAGQHALSDSCSCGQVGSCYRSAGAGVYEVWTGCQCAP